MSHLDPDHPTRERVHFPGTPGYVMATGKGTMAESAPVEAVQAEAEDAPSGITVTINEPTITVGPPPDAEDSPKPRQPKRARADKAKEG